MADECPLCGKDAELFRGPDDEEQDHYAKQAVGALHKLRQALERVGHAGNDVLAEEASRIIRRTEDLADLLREWRLN